MIKFRGNSKSRDNNNVIIVWKIEEFSGILINKREKFRI
jgi:hypothetical protein